MPSIEKLPQVNLGDDEIKRFDAAFETLQIEYNRYGAVKVIPDKFKPLTFKFLQNYKKEEENAEFQGLNPISGIGMRYPYVEDLVGATSTEWDANWATAGWYNLISVTQIAQTVLGTAVASVLKDSNNIPWAFVQFGLRSFHPSPKSKMYYPVQNEEPMAVQNVEYALRGSELKIATFDKPIYVPRNGKFLGLNLTRTTGNDVLVPWGITFQNSRRSKLTTFTRST